MSIQTQVELKRDIKRLIDSGTPLDEAVLALFHAGYGLLPLSHAASTFLDNDLKSAQRLVVKVTFDVVRKCDGNK